jgi:hypothetical protein
MNHNWYAVITAKVLMAKDISSTQKLMIALISNLSNEKGYCYATNSYIAKCLDVSPITISQNISDLENKGYIGRVIYLKNNVEQRFLTVNENPIHPPLNSIIPPIENHNTPPIENHNHNNKLFNNKEKNKTILSEQNFVLFWDKYNKKTDKEKCKDKFYKLSLSEQEKILSVVDLYVKKTTEVQYRKNPLTWLNGKCWEDDYSDQTQINNTNNNKPQPKYYFNDAEYQAALTEWERKNGTSNMHDL